MPGLSPFRIREFRRADTAGVSALILGMADCFAPHYTAEGMALYRGYAEPSAVAGRADGDYRLFLAVADDGCAGVIELNEYTHISMLLVRGDLRNSGIGTALLRRGISAARRAAADFRGLSVFAAPPAVDFYTRRGFSPLSGWRFERGVKYLPMFSACR